MRVKFTRIWPAVLVALATAQRAASFRYVAYWEIWASDTTPSADQLQGATNIILAFVNMTTMTDFVTSSNANFTPAFVADLKTKTDAKISAAFGGWGLDTLYPSIVATNDSMTQWANQVKTFMDTYGLDGVDLDWEYPTAAQGPQFVQLCTAVRNTIGADKVLSVTVPAIQTDMGAYTSKTIPEFEKQIDFWSQMNYDSVNRASTQSGHHAGGSVVKTDVETYQARGMSLDKMNIGFPMYAKWFQLTQEQGAACAAAGSPIGCPMGPFQTTNGTDLHNSNALTFDVSLSYDVNVVPLDTIKQSWASVPATGTDDLSEDVWASAWYDSANFLFWTWLSPDDIYQTCQKWKPQVGGVMVWSLDTDTNGAAGGDHFTKLNECITGVNTTTTKRRLEGDY